MRALTIDESFMRYVAEPSADLLRPLRNQILARPDYLPYAPVWQRLDQLVHDGHFGQVRELAADLHAWACLSPRWHYWLGVAALETGDPLEAGERRNVVQACLQGLLDTGDGTEDWPYLVTYPTDAYDILQALGELPHQQRLVETGHGQCDVLKTVSGEEYWFDVTDMLARASVGNSFPAACGIVPAGAGDPQRSLSRRSI